MGQISDRVFVVRSLSVERMDRALEACKRSWPDKDIVAITDFDGHAEMVSDSRVSNAIVPKSLENGFRGVWNTHENARIVVIPVGNQNGVGYGNVLKFMSRVRAREWYIASRGSTLRRIRLQTIMSQVRTEWWMRIACVPLSYLCALWFTRKQPQASSII